MKIQHIKICWIQLEGGKGVTFHVYIRKEQDLVNHVSWDKIGL